MSNYQVKDNHIAAEYDVNGNVITQDEVNERVKGEIKWLKENGTALSPEQVTNLAKIPTLSSQLDDTRNKQYINTNPIIIDMHYGALRGVGYNGQVAQFKWAYTTQDANIGDKILYLQFDADTVFVLGGLISIKYDDGSYESNIIDAIDSTNKKKITLRYPLSKKMTANFSKSAVYDFYENYAHPWKYGYNAIADFAIKELTRDSEIHLRRIYANEFLIIGTATSFLTTCDQYYKLGGTKQASWITSKAKGDGLKYNLTISESGNYKIKTILNANTSLITFKITNSANVVYLSNSVNSNTIESLKTEIYLSKDIYTVEIICDNTTEVGFSVLYLDLYKLDNKVSLSYYDRGTHVLLGDSWFENGSLWARLKELLPNANIINYGVGGNSATNILNRLRGIATISDKTNPSMTDDIFWSRANVKSIDSPTFIWVMDGTNDYLGGKNVLTYHNQMREITNEIVKLGAKPIIFNCSVGDINKNNNANMNDLFGLSRKYQDLTFLNNDLGYMESELIKTNKTIKTIIPFSNINTNASSKSLLATLYVSDTQNVIIERCDYTNEADKVIECGYSSVLGYLDHPTPTSITTSPTLNVNLGKPSVGGRYLNIVANNKTASSKIYNGSITIKIVSE